MASLKKTAWRPPHVQTAPVEDVGATAPLPEAVTEAPASLDPPTPAESPTPPADSLGPVKPATAQPAPETQAGGALGARRYQVWAHGALKHCGRFLEPGSLVDLDPELAASLVPVVVPVE